MKEKREKRLNSEFKKRIYELLSTKVKDDRLTEIFSITSVEITEDLKQAKVYVSIFSLDPEKKKSTFAAMCSAAPFIRRELSKGMHIYMIPELTFLLDNRAEYSDKIEKIIVDLKATGQMGKEDEDGGASDKAGEVKADEDKQEKDD